MGTVHATSGLAEALLSKNRRMILSLLLGHADEAFYLRQIVRTAGGGLVQFSGNCDNSSSAASCVERPEAKRSTFRRILSARSSPN